MEHWIAQANIERLKAQLAEEPPHDNRAELLRQLKAQQAILLKTEMSKAAESLRQASSPASITPRI